MMHSRDIDRVAPKPRPQITNLWCDVNEPEVKRDERWMPTPFEWVMAICAVAFIAWLTGQIIGVECVNCGGY